VAQTVCVCEKCGVEEDGRHRPLVRTVPCKCGSRHNFCVWCNSRVRQYTAKRFQRGGGKKTFFRVCPLSEELVVAEAMMKGGAGELLDRLHGAIRDTRRKRAFP
jgi:hypothetical protein